MNGDEMETPSTLAVPRKSHRGRIWLGVELTALGLAGHVLAARAIGGSYVAYRDHLFGFLLILLVTGVIIAGLGWRFWKGRDDISVLVLGAVQAIFGIVVYIERFNVH
jgi:hypothetical protein